MQIQRQIIAERFNQIKWLFETARNARLIYAHFCKFNNLKTKTTISTLCYLEFAVN